MWSSKVVTRLYNLVSSANKCTGDATTLGMSLMKQTNRSGSNALPLGMPLVTLAHVDLLPFTTTQSVIFHLTDIPLYGASRRYISTTPSIVYGFQLAAESKPDIVKNIRQQ